MLKRILQYASEHVDKSLGAALGVILIAVLGASVGRLRSCLFRDVTSPSKPVAPVSQSTPTSTVVMTNATPEELTQIPRNHTDVQAQHLIQPYIGKWMTVSGLVFDVSSETGNLTVVLMTPKSRVGVYMQFSSEQRNRVLGLNKNDEITATGRITKVDIDWLDLSDCTFEYTHTMVTSSPVSQSTPTSTVVMTNATPEELTQIPRNHTDVQAQRLTQPYIGKWMTVSGLVANVYLENGNPRVVFVTPKSRVAIEMHFSSEQSKRVLRLNQNDKITVTGQITDIRWDGVNLGNCTFEYTHGNARISQ